MARTGIGVLLIAVSACSTPTQQAAPVRSTVIPRSEAMTPPAMPLACDVEAASVGSWAHYEIKNPLMRDPYTTRYALVRKGVGGTTIEWTFDVTLSTALVNALVFLPGKDPPGQLTKLIMQDGALDPMDMRLPLPETQNFYARIDPRALVGTEEITVRAGSFSAKRYRYQTRFGENVDAWISESAWPICLVKLDAEQKQMPSWPGRFSYELIATGSDAKPQITRPPIPYDLEVLKKRDAEQRVREGRPDNAPRVGDTIDP